MDDRWGPQNRDVARTVALGLYDAGTPPWTILSGVATPARDLTPLTSRLQQTESQLTFTLSWHDELAGVLMPAPGQWVLVTLNGAPLCLQQIDSLTDFRVMHGVKQVTVVARSREAAGRWREAIVTTRTYAIGAPAHHVVVDVARAMGLHDTEVRLSQLGTSIPRANMQLSGISAWAALEQVMLPAGMHPSIDALGRLRGVSRDIQRPPDVVLTSDRVEGFSGSMSRAPLTRLALKWRAQLMRTVFLPERMLGEVTAAAGFFKLRQVHNVYFSQDRSARARNLRLVIVESCNGLLPVAKEELQYPNHDAASATYVSVVLTTNLFMPTFLGLYIGLKLGMAAVGDGVAVPYTISLGRLGKAFVDLAALAVILSFGTGRYQVYGQLLDAVEERNETVAYDPTSSPAAQKGEILESDFVANEATAIALVTREFIYRARAATVWTLIIVDDPSIEVGDIVELADGTRLCVVGFRRELSHSSAALLELTGFPA